MNLLKLKNSLTFALVIISLSFKPIVLASNNYEEKLLKNKLDNTYFKINSNYLRNIPRDEYIIGTGDLLNIVITKEIPEFSGSYKIDDNGTIFLPRLGRIYISGLTIGELINLLTQEYSKYIINPKIEILIEEYRSMRVYVDGEVESPGMYAFCAIKMLNRNTTKSSSPAPILKEVANVNECEETDSFNLLPTIYDAIKKSGGVTIFSDLQNVEVIRKDTLSNGGGKKKTTINFIDVLGESKSNQNIRVFDGDIIRIPKSKMPITAQLNKAIRSNLNPKIIQVNVIGRVENGGSYTLPKTSALNEALASAGGTKLIKGKVRFIRFNNDGSVDKRVFSFKPKANRGSYKNPYLKNGDLIIVGRSRFNYATEAINEITAPFKGIVSTYLLFSVINE